MRLALLLVCILSAAQAAERRYWIQPCTKPETGCQPGDAQLAEWALQDWARQSKGDLTVVKSSDRASAHIRIQWTSPNQGLYGEAQPILVGDVEGAEVYVLADLSGSGPDIAAAAKADPLLRDAIVYLTCLHETGHALGLPHTSAFEDIMYSFQFGGDIPGYFGRYRKQLMKRVDIQKTTGTSEQDRHDCGSRCCGVSGSVAELRCPGSWSRRLH
ncbi:MAG: hypothetical protein WDO18_02855 [Acidobacteriota bacterium]